MTVYIAMYVIEDFSCLIKLTHDSLVLSGNFQQIASYNAYLLLSILVSSKYS